jgi:hypothetical protein
MRGGLLAGSDGRPTDPAQWHYSVSCGRSRAPFHAKQQSGLASANGERGTKPARRKVVGYPPLSELSHLQRREFHEALLDAATFEELPGKWQAAILKAEQNRPTLRIVTSD